MSTKCILKFIQISVRERVAILMEQNGGLEGRNEHVIEIVDENQALFHSMNAKVLATPKLLRKSAGKRSCCIFKVPHTRVLSDHYAYCPHIISIGPYHYGKDHLKMMQEQKWRFLHKLLCRTSSKSKSLINYLSKIRELEDKARECYSEFIDVNSDEFVEMMVLDGCFVIELFRMENAEEDTDFDDPILSIPWMKSFILRDFVKLENQIPFFVLHSLFDLSTIPGEEDGPSLATLALKTFNALGDRPDTDLENYQTGVEKVHLLDLLRSSFIPPAQEEGSTGSSFLACMIECLSKRCHFIPCAQQERSTVPTSSNGVTECMSKLSKRMTECMSKLCGFICRAPRTSPGMIECVSKLGRAGITFKVRDDHSFLNIKYRSGVIEMPKVSMDDFTIYFLLNCVTFEQCYKYRTKEFTTYAAFMDSLTNTNKDVEVLCDAGIIQNLLSTDEDVALFFNTLGKDVGFDIADCYLTGLFSDVNEHFRNQVQVKWASFKDTYFSTPWSFLSSFAALVLLGLSVTQTIYSARGN